VKEILSNQSISEKNDDSLLFDAKNSSQDLELIKT